MILRELGRRFGLSGSYASASEVFDEVASQVPAFAGMSYRALGALGRPVAGT
jgi:predicted molibdopterin-dependent oxidoreductase YjgC